MDSFTTGWLKNIWSGSTLKETVNFGRHGEFLVNIVSLYHTHALDYKGNMHGTFMGVTHLSRNLTDAKGHIHMYIASVYEHSSTRSFPTELSQ